MFHHKKSFGFFRMWSDDGNGFPLPKGCYFGPAQGVQLFFFKKINAPKNREEGGRGLVMKSLGFYFNASKKTSGENWGNESTPRSFF